ncbi:MAG: hypothetical protein US61_C0042G0006 [Parcubacteria group bacterium GW2011_GWE2_37_8]|nr:MAG: hypothetical protein US61_C0042G0006 [Parcubacteria group bacterium GW2011_GWE2_37_8]
MNESWSSGLFINGNDVYEFIKIKCRLDGRVSLNELMTRYSDPIEVNKEVDELVKTGLIKRDYSEDVEIYYGAV